MKKIIFLLIACILLFSACSEFSFQLEPETGETTEATSIQNESNIIDRIHFMESSTSPDTPVILPIEYDPIVLQDENGYHSVEPSLADMYGQPWFLFHMDYEGAEVVIRTMNLTATLDLDTIEYYIRDFQFLGN